jgi:hypothetical protein
MTNSRARAPGVQLDVVGHLHRGVVELHAALGRRVSRELVRGADGEHEPARAERRKCVRWAFVLFCYLYN